MNYMMLCVARSSQLIACETARALVEITSDRLAALLRRLFQPAFTVAGLLQHLQAKKYRGVRSVVAILEKMRCGAAPASAAWPAAAPPPCADHAVDGVTAREAAAGRVCVSPGSGRARL
jgi:hypothetical protein